MLAQFGYCAPLLEALGVKCYQAPGFEADDVIASLTQWGREKGLNVVIVSEDKDMLQLVDTGVHILKNVYDKDLALIGR